MPSLMTYKIVVGKKAKNELSMIGRTAIMIYSFHMIYNNIWCIKYRINHSRRGSTEFYFRAEIVINVKYGNGFVETIRVGRSSTGSPFMKMYFPRKPLNKAFKDSVKDIINNKNIQGYINK